MLLKLLLKIWPSLTPIIAYIFWVYIVEGILIKKLFSKNKVIDAKREGQKEYVIKEPKAFSLNNKRFVFILYITLILSIFTFINFAFDF